LKLRIWLDFGNLHKEIWEEIRDEDFS
jgi:hypothetical protein